MQPRMTMACTIKLYKLPDETATPGLRRMRPEDVPQVSVWERNIGCVSQKWQEPRSVCEGS